MRIKKRMRLRLSRILFYYFGVPLRNKMFILLQFCRLLRRYSTSKVG